MAISEKELQERIALEGIDGPVGSLRDDMNAAKIIQAVQIGNVKNPQDLDDAAVQWDAKAADDRRKRKLRQKLKGKNR